MLRIKKALGKFSKNKFNYQNCSILSKFKIESCNQNLNPNKGIFMDRNLALESVRVTEAAALASWMQMGRGDEKIADQVAVDAMRTALNGLRIDGTIVIGEGERDEAPMLYIGEKVGKGGPKVDIALDPLEGTTITAKGGMNALTVIAMAEHGGFLHAPDVYMEKIAVGGHDIPEGLINIDDSASDNVKRVAKHKGIPVEALVVCIMDRERHEKLIKDVREAGAKIVLIDDGDVSAVIATALDDGGIDMYMGTGGAPEGVLAAAALRCLGGKMEARLLFRNDVEKSRAKKWGITDLNKKYTLLELASGDVLFAATGVTDGQLLRGVKRKRKHAKTHSIVMRSKSGTVRTIEAEHNFNLKTGFDHLDLD
jgi:fructose-1,6-bisphosphatase II / sedoheptulose-1,7-bisphosphatase